MFNYKLLVLYLMIISFFGCAYFNILFNAESKYDAGIKKIEESKDKKITSEIRNDFQAAIDKCWKLLNIYSDSSKYADDALLIIGKSHYHLQEYVKSERFLAQFVDRYRNSSMISEAYLWHGMSLIELDRDQEALESLNRVLADDESDELNARAYISLGRIYLKQENWDQARKQFIEVFEITGNDQFLGESQFLIGESYYLEKNYNESITNYKEVMELNASVDLLFRAGLRIVDSYLYMDQYDQAILTLESISSESKFLHKKSVVLSIIGNCYKDQGMFIEATEIYDDVLYTYPRTEGSASAAYGLGQLMEFAYSDLDSAKNLYLRVGKEYRESEYKADADSRVKVITSYQKIIANIEKDLTELQNLAIDAEEQDSVDEELPVEDVEEENRNGRKNDKKPQPKSKRTESEIRISLQRHYFSKAEFFLLSLSNYDSAAAGYASFIQVSEDSLLVPKAHYALYYIYGYELNDQVKADSLKQIILSDYPDSPYAHFLTTQDGTFKEQEEQESPYKFLYLQGEAMMSDERYLEAIDYFNQIAEEDSGSDLAQKARYATAWIYENKMEDVENAVSAYAVLAEEYPNSDAGRIAINKIKVPVQVEMDSTEVLQDSTFYDTSDSTYIEDSEAAPPSLEEQLDLNTQDIDNQNENNQDPPENP
jgi:tetratricopeptide (TPR) repeat protein